MLINNILIIIQRSNGDVFLSASLISQLKENFHPCKIDLLVNDDTLPIAETLHHINKIFTFSYKKKKEERWLQEKTIFRNIYRKYDMSINLTASDRSVLYALLASSYAISAVEKSIIKSWWKRLLLKFYYNFDSQKHILLNNLVPLSLLGLEYSKKVLEIHASKIAVKNIKEKLDKLNITNFLIFHPSAQYKYKVYSESLRNELLHLFSETSLTIIVTGGVNAIDLDIKNTLPKFKNIFDWIGDTSINEYIALSSLSDGYVGMDTLNMHIAASQNKRIFAIFGPTNLSMWSPWSNHVQSGTKNNLPVQTYGNITIFQANMACVACGKAGCNNQGISE